MKVYIEPYVKEIKDIRYGRFKFGLKKFEESDLKKIILRYSERIPKRGKEVESVCKKIKSYDYRGMLKS